MPTIRIDLETARATSAAIPKCAEEIETAVRRLDAYVRALQEDWIGVSERGFTARYTAWRANMMRLSGDLDSLRRDLERGLEEWEASNM